MSFKDITLEESISVLFYLYVVESTRESELNLATTKSFSNIAIEGEFTCDQYGFFKVEGINAGGCAIDDDEVPYATITASDWTISATMQAEYPVLYGETDKDCAYAFSNFEFV